MATQTSTPLTHELTVADGAHILYFYTDEAAYIKNALSFIEAGIAREEPVIFIDSKVHTEVLLVRLQDNRANLRDVRFIDNDSFYGISSGFNYDRVLQNLKDLVDPFVQSEEKVRFWGQVDWQEEENALEQVHQYEYSCDITVSELNLLSVCAYDAKQLAASVQIEMMRTHGYWMTDKELVRSPLYSRRHSHLQHVFPSLSVKPHIGSETDLYKHKLDFVHVVSHEVRNPLTVIQAYASMLARTESDASRAEKLQTIVDYAMVINHEISHIIETEQLLLADGLWKKSIVSPRAILDEVLHAMETKGRTQNVHLQVNVDIPYLQTVFSSKISLKLIFSNIISNAIQYSHEGSTVDVRVQVVDAWLVFTVKDYGVGMAPNQVKGLFRMGHRTHHQADSQGIGLFIVKNLVDDLQGEIQIDSELNVGTEVVIRLPVL